MPFGNSQIDVPKGQLKLAQRFNAGAPAAPGQVPEGRLKEGAGEYVQSSLRDSNCIDGIPGVETPGYSRDVPPGHRSSNFREAPTLIRAANLSVNLPGSDGILPASFSVLRWPTWMPALPDSWSPGASTGWRSRLSPNRCQERGQPCSREPKSGNSRTKLSALLSVVVSQSRSAILDSWRLQSRIHAVEQESTEGTENWVSVESIVCFGAQIARKGDSAQRIWRRRKSMFSLRFLLFPIE